MRRPPAAVFHPIGRVQDGVIRVHSRWTRALDGIEGFSHLLVLFWLHKARPPKLRIHPRGDRRIPMLGFLATRTPHRANPIGATVVRLLKRRGNRLWVGGLDAWNGTPVLDIKPYTLKDSIRNPRLPGWVKRLDKAETDPLRKYGRR